MTEQLEKAIQHIKTRADAWAVKEVTEALQSISERMDKALSQEYTDAVSREWLMRKAIERFYTTNYFNHISAMIEEAPSVTPKSGKWIYSDLLRVKHGTMNIDTLIDKVWAKMESEDV